MSLDNIGLTKAQVPKVYRSALISIGGFAIAIAAYLGVKALFPSYDFGIVEASILGSFGSFLTNYVKLVLTQD